MTEPSQKITKALLFAAIKHADQRRKGMRQEPYINHLAEVADLLARHTDGTNTDLICAGLLHDAIEDSGTKFEELVREFGPIVANIVQECTDDKSLPKTVRKRLQAQTAPHKSHAAKMVKLADKISNLHTILESPPPDWDLARRQEYFSWSKSVIDGCRGVNAGLEGAFDNIYNKGVKELGMETRANWT